MKLLFKDIQFKTFEKNYKFIKHIMVGLLSIIVLGSILIVLGTATYFHHLTQEASNISDTELKHRVLHFSGDEILNHDKNILTEYDHSQNSLIVGPKHVNSNVIKALISSEDTLFFKHDGILPKALIRAMIQDVLSLNSRSGGSTITQQLIKNQVLTNEKTYSRKANEIIYTYLNIVPFGRDYNGANITGIASASYSLFNVPPSKLNVAQSAYLVGLLQSPYTYTPYENNGDLKAYNEVKISIDRQHYVLKRMLVEGVITKKTYQQAKQYTIYDHLLTKPQ